MGVKEDRLRRRSSGKKGLARGGGSSGLWLHLHYMQIICRVKIYVRVDRITTFSLAVGAASPET
jgi:hypothetical protein